MAAAGLGGSMVVDEEEGDYLRRKKVLREKEERKPRAIERDNLESTDIYGG